MAAINILYSRDAFNNMLSKVKESRYYISEEKNVLFKMILQMKAEDWLLYMVDIYREEQFNFPIHNFAKYKRYISNEVYGELVSQLLEKCADYEEISYGDIREWFDGMTIDADFLKMLESHLREINVRILY